MSDKPIPMVCPECRELPESYYGILHFPGQDLPKCPNHKTADGEERPVELVPAVG